MSYRKEAEAIRARTSQQAQPDVYAASISMSCQAIAIATKIIAAALVLSLLTAWYSIYSADRDYQNAMDAILKIQKVMPW